jgi:hypothetical protein
VKFIFADSLDMVDPAYDFIQDRNGKKREGYWDDLYPHEILGYAPYDGMLVSRGIVGDHRISGKYTEAQAQRFRRVGARAFLRLDQPEFQKLALFGDCGAFTYVNEDKPPYTPENMIEFYEDGGFSHGCSVDHIIFDFDRELTGMAGGSADAKYRFDITLENAATFIRESQHLSKRFTPLGVVQGWSPDSMAEAAIRLVRMGYRYLALGGMVPLKSEDIRRCLAAVRGRVSSDIKLHILGFAKADEIESFQAFQITSFDTTSPLIRAFKDKRNNYYLPAADGKLKYFSAIRVPQALDNFRLRRLVQKGQFHAEDLIDLESKSLQYLRAFDNGEADLEPTLEAVLAYNSLIATERPFEDVCSSPKMTTLASLYRRTLSEKPWKSCSCAICRTVSIEVIIFRASNRNKRRGMHNLVVYKGLIDRINNQEGKNEPINLFGHPCAAEC